MAYNVISGQKVAENTQILKIAKFAYIIWAPELRNHPKYPKNFALNRDLLKVTRSTSQNIFPNKDLLLSRPLKSNKWKPNLK